MITLPISNKRRTSEISTVVLTAAGKFLFMDYLNWRFHFIAVAIILWVSYILYRFRKEKSVIAYWGFRTDNFETVLRKVLPFGLVSAITFVGVGLYQNTLNLTWHIIPILILYPIWGTIQQFLLIALTAGNMQDMHGHSFNKISIILFSALLFASVHYPHVWLMIATFVLAVFYGIIYLRERNLYVLGIFHGWLGGLFYYTVLGRDPFLETFGKLLNSTN
jgi:membrane protease YdiL (CAAX protease family)